MAPIIPTHRPLVTPERAAIAVAVAAVASSLFVAFGAGRSEASPASLPALACPEPTATASWEGLQSPFDDSSPRLH